MLCLLVWLAGLSAELNTKAKEWISTRLGWRMGVRRGYITLTFGAGLDKDGKIGDFSTLSFSQGIMHGSS